MFRSWPTSAARAWSSRPLAQGCSSSAPKSSRTGRNRAPFRLTRESPPQHPEFPARLSLFEGGDALLGAVEMGGVLDSRPFRRTVRPLLADRCFLLCGASLAHKLYHVRGIESTPLGGVLLSSGEHVPLPRNAQAAAKRRWIEY